MLFCVCLYLLLLDLNIVFSGGRSGGLVFPSLEEFFLQFVVIHTVIFPQFVVIHTVRDFGVVNKADVFLELCLFFFSWNCSCFLDDPMDVGNLISGSSAFSQSSLNIWKFTDHVLLKPGLENFEHYFASM